MRARARAILLLVVALAGVGGAATVGFRVYAARRLEQARARFEADAGSLDPASYAPGPVEAEANAAAWLTAGIEAIGLATEQQELVTREYRLWARPGPQRTKPASMRSSRSSSRLERRWSAP